MTAGAVVLPVAPAVALTGVGIRVRRQWLVRGVDLTVLPGELAVVTGPARGARTLLLLAAAGRLRPDEGRVRLGPAGAGLGVLQGVNELDPSLTVADAVRERKALIRASAHVDVGLPGSARLQDLPPLDLLLLGADLALLGEPGLLVVDDVDEASSVADVARAWHALRAVADRGTAVLAGALDPTPLADVVVPTTFTT